MVVRRVVITLVMCFFMGGIAHGQARSVSDSRVANQFIQDGVSRIIRILKAHKRPRSEVAALIRREIREFFDMSEVVSLTLGRARQRATAVQLASFRREFEDLLVYTWTTRVRTIGPKIRSYNPNILRVVDTTRVGGKWLMVRSEINGSGARWIKIDWRLRMREKGLRIVDVVVLGISQARTYKSEFASVMRNSGRGLDGLIDALRRKNQALRAP